MGSSPEPSETEAAGTRIGPYKLLERIGEGGFGSVFMAEQEEPIRRRVALKVLKLGMDSRQVIARFEAERQALALMDHPNIARVLDAGTTASGRPYFVMELVKGVPITTYCDEAHLSTAKRVSVFLPVCHAIQHAHQKGIIHRDLKPSNVLVTLHDGKPVPKVIDFGIAKATEQRLTEKTLFTGFGQMIGTPAYMSPEQAEMSGLDIDTRSDVYSLGVLLYELLAGAPPFDPARLREAGLAEILRIIKEEEPPKPSTKASTLEGRRATEPKKLGALLRGDLDCVVMKALAKERQRRYDSASTLAQDLERYLAHEPVSAAPPGVAYRASKFVRRNRVAVLGAMLVALTLVGGIVGTSTGLVHARAAEREAKRNAEDADAKFQIAREGADLILETVSRELPRVPGTRALVSQLLDAALAHYEKLAAEKPGDANEQRRIWIAFQFLGDSYEALGEVDEADRAFDRFRSLVEPAAAAHPEIAEFQADLAVSFERRGRRAFYSGDLESARRSFEEERSILTRRLVADPGDDAARRLSATNSGWLARLAGKLGRPEEDLDWRRRQLAIYESLAAEDPRNVSRKQDVARSLVCVASAVTDPKTLFDRADELYAEIARLEGDTTSNLYERAQFLQTRMKIASRRDDVRAADEHGRAAEALLERLIAAEPRNSAYLLEQRGVLHNRALIAADGGDLEAARAHYERALALARRAAELDGGSIFSRDAMATCANNLAELADRCRDFPSMREWGEFSEGIYADLARTSPDDPVVRQGQACVDLILGRCDSMASDTARARERFERADRLLGSVLAMQPSDEWAAFNRIAAKAALGDVIDRTGDPAGGERLHREALEIAEALVRQHPDVARYGTSRIVQWTRLAAFCESRSDREGAAELLERGRVELERFLDVNPDHRERRFLLGFVHQRLGDLAVSVDASAAQKQFERAVEIDQGLLAAEPGSLRFGHRLGLSLGRLADQRMRMQRPGAALDPYQRMLDVLRRVCDRAPDFHEARNFLAYAAGRLDELHTARGDLEIARTFARIALEERKLLAERPGAEVDWLNNYAWLLLTCGPPELRDTAAAVRFARLAVERTRSRVPWVLDTYALACFENGDADAAVEAESKAIELLGDSDPPRRAGFEERLARYRETASAGGR